MKMARGTSNVRMQKNLLGRAYLLHCSKLRSVSALIDCGDPAAIEDAQGCNVEEDMCDSRGAGQATQNRQGERA